jgi:hypothetical protein
MFIGVCFVLLLGTLAHFFYDWSGQNAIVGLFCPVNESTWEHMKLVFFPMILYSFFMIPHLESEYPCIVSSSLLGIILSAALIPVLFYTYTGILGFDVFFLDLLTFVFSVLIGFYAIYRLTRSCKIESCKVPLLCVVWLQLFCFIVFRYFPPNIGLFANPTV